jgi:methylmalonyl-CoA mutase
MSKKLFKDFNAVSEAQWKQKIQFDLKGADYNDTLVSETADGIHVKPFYHSENSNAHNIPFSGTATGDWYVSQKIHAYNAAAANKKAQNVLSRGAQGVILVIPNADVDPEILLADLPEVGIQVHLQFLDHDYIANLHRLRSKAYVHIDVIHQLASDGNWFKTKESDLNFYKKFISKYTGYFSNITVNTSVYQLAGATVGQEMAYYTAHLNEYLNVIDDAGLIQQFDAQQPNHKRINIDVATGSDYFFEIAKYRAYRVLTKSLGQQYGIDLACYISASPSTRNKSLLDYNVNLLRTTTESMSAILGGADTVYNLPYDEFFNKPNEFGERIARNQLLILKEEAYFDKVGNPSEGSYYIETITQQLVEKALEIFKQIETAGGMITSLFEGTIQRKIKESDDRERNAFKHNDKILVGVNKYPNDSAPLKNEYELFPFLKKKPRKTLVTPLIAKRLSEDLEQQKMAH